MVFKLCKYETQRVIVYDPWVDRIFLLYKGLPKDAKHIDKYVNSIVKIYLVAKRTGKSSVGWQIFGRFMKGLKESF